MTLAGELLISDRDLKVAAGNCRAEIAAKAMRDRALGIL